MKRVTSEELKRRLGHYLDAARSGEIVQIMEGGQLIAELRPPKATTLTPGLPRDPGAYQPSPLSRAVRSADLLDAEREER